MAMKVRSVMVSCDHTRHVLSSNCVQVLAMCLIVTSVIMAEPSREICDDCIFFVVVDARNDLEEFQLWYK